MEEKVLRSRVKGLAVISFLLLSVSLFLIFQGHLFIEVDGRSVGVGQMLWLPGLIGSCSCLWLLLTLSGVRGSISIPISLVALAGAEFCALLLPVREVSGLAWEAGNGLVPAITFAALAMTSLTWTALGLIDPLRSSWWTYAVALAAVMLVGLILSYQYFFFLQGGLATALAAALVWGMAYDGRLYRYGKGREVGRRRFPTAVFLVSFLGLPMLLLGLPYLLQ